MKAEESILKHIGLAGVLKGYGIYDNVITAMEDYKKEAQQQSTDIVGALHGSDNKLQDYIDKKVKEALDKELDGGWDNLKEREQSSIDFQKELEKYAKKLQDKDKEVHELISKLQQELNKGV